jgi:hypothetical protein
LQQAALDAAATTLCTFSSCRKRQSSKFPTSTKLIPRSAKGSLAFLRAAPLASADKAACKSCSPLGCSGAG